PPPSHRTLHDALPIFELTAQPFDNLTINASAGYTDRGNETGRPVGFPDWTASGGIQYTFESAAANGTITPRLDWFYNSEIAYSRSEEHTSELQSRETI